MMSDDQILNVVHGARDGKSIQYRSYDGNWYEYKCSSNSPVKFDFITFDYRVAPEPRKPRHWQVGVNQFQELCRLTENQHKEVIIVREVIE